MPDDQYPPPNDPPPHHPPGQPPPQAPPNQPPPSHYPPNSYPPPAWPPAPGGYYPPPGGYYPPQAPPVNATLILVFGIIGIVFTFACGIGGVFGIVAWIMGNSALKTLDQVGDPLNQRGTVNAGRICGIAGAILMVLGILFYAVFIGIGIFEAAHDHSKGV